MKLIIYILFLLNSFTASALFNYKLFDNKCPFEALKPQKVCDFNFADKKFLETSFQVQQASCQAQQKSVVCEETDQRFSFLKSHHIQCDLNGLCSTYRLGSKKEAIEGCRNGLEQAFQELGQKAPKTLEDAEKLIDTWGNEFWNLVSEAPGFSWEAFKKCINEESSCSPSKLYDFFKKIPDKAKSHFLELARVLERFDCLDQIGRFELLCYQSSLLTSEFTLGVVAGGVAKNVVGDTLIHIYKSQIADSFSAIDLAKKDLVKDAKLTSKSDSKLTSSAISNTTTDHAPPVGLAKLQAKYGKEVEVVMVSNRGNQYPTFAVKDKASGVLMGTLDIKYDEKTNTVKMGTMFTIAKFREMGVGETLFESVLKEFPDTKFIDTASLEDENRAVISTFMSKGYSYQKALKETPAYKIRSKFGFTEIVSSSTKMSTYTFKVKRPGK